MDYEAINSASRVAFIQKKNVLIGGNLVFATLKPNDQPPEGYFAQEPRSTQRQLSSVFRSSKDKLYIWLHPSLLEFRNNIKVTFSVDAYLKWGLRQEGLYALIGGIENEEDNFRVDVLVFNKNKLIEIYDRELPGRASKRFDSAAQSICDELLRQHPGVTIHVASPLTDWQQRNCTFIDGMPIANLRFKPLTTLNNQKKDFIVPGAIALTGLVTFCGFAWHGWKSYSDSLKQYEITKLNPVIQKQGGVDSYYISVMTQRRLLLTNPRKQDHFSEKVSQLLSGIKSIPDVHVLEIRSPGKPAAEAKSSANEVPETADVSMSISVPKGDSSAVDQLKSVIGTISSNTNYTIRSATPAWKEDNDRRIFNMEGTLNGK